MKSGGVASKSAAIWVTNPRNPPRRRLFRAEATGFNTTTGMFPPHHHDLLTREGAVDKSRKLGLGLMDGYGNYSEGGDGLRHGLSQ